MRRTLLGLLVILAGGAGGPGCSIDTEGMGPVRPGRDGGRGGTDGASPDTGGLPSCDPPGCSDGIECTLDTCSGGTCTHLPDHAACTAATGGYCDPSLDCQYPSCGRGCDDGNDCTMDVCGGASTCEHLPTEGGCNDGDLCTIDEVCVEGACLGTPITCDDGNPCTIETCDPALGCVGGGVATRCDDGDPCTSEDACDGDARCVGVPCPIMCYCEEGEGCRRMGTGDECGEADS